MATKSSDVPQDDDNSEEDIGYLVQEVYKDLIIKHVRVGTIIGRMSVPDDYAYLSKLLLGKAVADPETHREHIKLLEYFSKDIAKTVDFDRIYHKLIEDFWMDRADYELLRCLANNNGNTAAMRWMVYYVLPKRKENWMKQFLQILRDLDYNGMAARISGEDATGCVSEMDTGSTFTDDDRMNIAHGSGSAYSSMNNLDAPGLPFTSTDKRKRDEESSMKMKRVKDWTQEQTLEMPQCFSETDSILSSVENNAQVEFDAADVTPNLIAVREKTIKELESRPYQEELARSASAGNNVIIIAPTGCGKTVVAIRIMQKHLEMKRKEHRKGKIAFFANEVTLVDQQHEMCKSHISSTFKTIQIVGETKDKTKIPASDLIAQNDIIFMTPQILVNSLSRNYLESLSVFSLMVFDECHNVSSKHPSNMIMAAYMDMKFNGILCLPQVVGLTASVGTGRKKAGTQLGGAVEHIKGLCARLDARGGLVTVRENKDSLAEYTKLVETAIKRTSERLDDPFKNCIINIMDKIEEKILETGDYLELRDDEEIKSTMDKSTMAYKQWLSKMYLGVLPRIENVSIRKPLLTYIEHLTVYNKALVINEDCRGRDAMICISEFMESNLHSSQGEERWLHGLFIENKTNLENECRAHANLNPKLKLLKLEIVDKLRKDPRSKILVLVKTRDLAKALLCWMRETGDLKQLNPVIVTGCGAASDKGGMTRAEQIRAVKSFKWGESHAAIATSVAEEGMDFAHCNRVIRYEYVSNEIGTVQARGRASRADGGDYCLITGSASMVTREQNNFRLEKVMNEAVEQKHADTKSNPEAFVDTIEKLQRKEKTDRDFDKKQQQSKTLSKDPNAHRINCYKCDKFICRSTDIRVLNKCHHMVMTPDIGTLVNEVAHKKPTTFDGIRKCSKIHCKDCNMDWGVTVIYRDVKFAMFTPKGLLFYPPQGQQYHLTLWKNSPFSCQDLTEADLMSYKPSFEIISQLQA